MRAGGDRSRKASVGKRGKGNDNATKGKEQDSGWRSEDDWTGYMDGH